MPTKAEHNQTIANLMLKGVNNEMLPEHSKRLEYFKKYEEEIEWVAERLPKCSAAVGAVITKALLKHGKESVVKFCDSIKNQNFNGINDPPFLLWKLLHNHNIKINTKTIYQKTLCAVKAHLENRTIKILTSNKTEI